MQRVVEAAALRDQRPSLKLQGLQHRPQRGRVPGRQAGTPSVVGPCGDGGGGMGRALVSQQKPLASGQAGIQLGRVLQRVDVAGG